MNKNNICEILYDSTTLGLIGYADYTANQAQNSSNNAQPNLGLILDGNNIVPNNKRNVREVNGSGLGTSTNPFNEVYTEKLGTPGNSSLDLNNGKNGQVLGTDGYGKLIWKNISEGVTLKTVQGNYLSISNQQIESGIIPVSLGGTGATIPLVARNNLGLGKSDIPTFQQIFVNDYPPNHDNQVVTKKYADYVAQGLVTNKPVTVATNGKINNISTLGYGINIDNIELKNTDRVLVKDQIDKTQNGIYTITGENTATRTSVTDTQVGSYYYVEEGTKYGTTSFVVSSVNGEKIEFVQFSSASQISAGQGLTKDGNTLNVNLKSNGGIKTDSNELALYLSASNITGTLSIQHGGTGATNASDALKNLGLIQDNGNTSLGSSALVSNNPGTQNTAVGSAALIQNNNATANTAVGDQAGLDITTGSNNVCIGTVAGGNLNTGCENVFIGMNAMVKDGSGFESGSNQICIGYNVNSKGNNTAVIGNPSLTDLYVGSGTNQNTGVSYEGAANIHCNSVILTQEFTTVPASSNAQGTKGEIRWSSDYLFVCTDPNSWKRVPLGEF